jgi:hypothetical protein
VTADEMTVEIEMKETAVLQDWRDGEIANLNNSLKASNARVMRAEKIVAQQAALLQDLEEKVRSTFETFDVVLGRLTKMRHNLKGNLELEDG